MKNLFFILIPAIIIITGCRKENNALDYQPVAEFIVAPDTGNTTTVFLFDASKALEHSLEDNPVFLRWDWDSDGVWDEVYSSGAIINHRFYQKGVHTVTLEAATLLGKKDSSQTVISISQGYSPPRSVFTVSPDSANIKTLFTFDGSASNDDEDSLQQLLFRWDFEGDEIWDTEYSSEPVIQHIYDDNRVYPAVLEVKDPGGLTGRSLFNVNVTRFNDRINPIPEYECWPCTIEDTIRMDAGGSYIRGLPNAELFYSWDIFNDNIWESIDKTSPLFNYKIPIEGEHQIKLRVSDSEGLYMDSVFEVGIFPFNTPPVAVLVLGNPYGNPSTEFYMHAKHSYDRETKYLDRIIQWDLNDDGIFEEKYNNLYEIRTEFDRPGKYPIALKVTDSQDKSSFAYDTILVVNGTRPTGILEDKRSPIPEYYGTVKIGDTWWTQNNARYVPPPPPNPSYPVDTYRGQADSVYRYGYLYPHAALKSQFNPCPDGWRIPSLDDWNKLMEELSPGNRISDLLPGGSSELHILLTGHRMMNEYSGRGELVHYYTTSNSISGNVFLWYIDKIRNKNMSVVSAKIYYLPIRCVK